MRTKYTPTQIRANRDLPFLQAVLRAGLQVLGEQFQGDPTDIIVEAEIELYQRLTVDRYVVLWEGRHFYTYDLIRERGGFYEVMTGNRREVPRSEYPGGSTIIDVTRIDWYPDVPRGQCVARVVLGSAGSLDMARSEARAGC